MGATRSTDPGLGRHDDTGLGRHDDGATAVDLGRRHDHDHGKAVETKPAFKTTEFIAYLGLLAGILIAGLVTDGADDLGPTKVWLYATLLTIGYMVSRGIAKAGSYQPGDDPRS